MGTHYQGTKVERRALDTFIKLTRAAEATNNRVNEHLHAHNLTVSQFGVLEALYHLGPLPVGQVGEKILRSSANMTLVVDNLARRGLIERRRGEDDRRRVDLSLTPEGRALVAGILPGHVAGVVTAIGALSAEEQETLGALCRKLGLAQATSQAHTALVAEHPPESRATETGSDR